MNFVFPALTLGAQNSLSVSCVSVFPRSQFRPWFTVPSAQVWWSSAQVWGSSAPPWWSSVQVWWSSALSAPPWWAPALSAPHWWASSTPPWRSSVLSAPHWWAPALSAPPWRSAVWLWWSSAPPWGSSDPSALLWWSSAPPVLPAPSWSPCFAVLPQSQGLTPLHGPGPPSLPLFRLRSTALLDCVMFRASGSRSLGGGGLCHEFGPWTSIRSPPEVTLPSYWLSHYTDCSTLPCTTVPMIHCTKYTQLSQSHAHTWELSHNYHTPYISHGLPLPLGQVLICV